MGLRLSVLENRGLIRISGEDAREFLQGIVSNDVHKISPERAMHAAFLTAQGKYLYDFFAFEMAGDIWLECEANRAAEFCKRLSMYRLRARVSIEESAGSNVVAALFGEGAAAAVGLAGGAGQARPFAGGVAFVDPRLAEAGVRIVLPAGEFGDAGSDIDATPTDFAEYDSHRIGLGLPDGSRDMVIEKTILLEAGFDELGGVDWDKGCFLGQELTARTKYRGLIKRRLVPVEIDGPMPQTGTPIMAGEKQAGEMRSSSGNLAIALLRLEYLKSETDLIAEGARVHPQIPNWAII